MEYVKPTNEVGHGKLELSQSTIDKKMKTFNWTHRASDDRVKHTTAMARGYKMTMSPMLEQQQRVNDLHQYYTNS